MAIRCTIMRASGEIETETFDADEAPLEYLQKAVGGYVEQVQALKPKQVFANEDGALRGLPKNDAAFERFGDVPGSVDGYLRGDVVLVEAIQ